MAITLSGIHGWFSIEAAMLFAWIDEVQKQNKIVGNIFEIGVHHGKSTVFLGAMVRQKVEALGVCDIFDRQSSNISKSGGGNRIIFERNMYSFLQCPPALKVFAVPSASLRVRDIGIDYRFFHIDGGHSLNETLGDLKIASQSLNKKGVIVLDDPFRADWPGVTEAAVRFLDTDKRFCGVIAGFNKLVIVRREFAALYSMKLDDPAQRTMYGFTCPWRLKVCDFVGWPLRVFHIPIGSQAPDSKALNNDLARNMFPSR